MFSLFLFFIVALFGYFLGSLNFSRISLSLTTPIQNKVKLQYDSLLFWLLLEGSFWYFYCFACFRHGSFPLSQKVGWLKAVTEADEEELRLERKRRSSWPIAYKQEW